MADEDVEEQTSRVEKLKDAFRSHRPKEDKFPAQVNLVFNPEPPKAESTSRLQEETPKSREAETPKLMAWSPRESVAQSHDQIFIEARENALKHAYETRYEARSWQNLKAGVAIDRTQYIQLVHLEPEKQRDALLAELRQKERTLLKSEMHDWLEGAIYELIQGHQRVYSMPSPLAAFPADKLPVEMRRDLEAWQVQPDNAGVLRLAEMIVEAIAHKHLLIMMIDVDPFTGLTYGGGKSQLLYQILQLAYMLLGRVYDPRKDTVYQVDGDRMDRMLDDNDPVPWGVDEINQFYDKWNWNNPENKRRTLRLQRYRKAKRPIVGAGGSIWEMNERMRLQIITHRCEITKWVEDWSSDPPEFYGEFTLYEKYGPPKLQVEEENKWGREMFPGKFRGLAGPSFNILEACALKAESMDGKGGLDAWMFHNHEWLEEFVQKPPLRPETPGNAEVPVVSDSTQTPSGVGEP